MKLRIHQSSLRIRLSKGDMQRLQEALTISDKLPFPGGEQLIYTLQIASIAHATLDANTLKVTISKEAFEYLRNDDRYMIVEELPTAESTLSLIVERDFHDL